MSVPAPARAARPSPGNSNLSGTEAFKRYRPYLEPRLQRVLDRGIACGLGGDYDLDNPNRPDLGDLMELMHAVGEIKARFR